MIVTFRHVATIPGFGENAGWCSGQSRAWAARHGFDWSDFLRNGIESERLLATGDGFALKLVEWACECEAKEAAGGR